MAPILVEASLPVVFGLALVAAVARGVQSSRLCRLAASVRASALVGLLAVLAALGLLAVGAAVAKLSTLPLGVAGLLLLGPSLAVYVHVELFAAADGYRRLGVAGTADRSRLSRFEHWFAGWVTYVSQRHAWLPVAAVGTGVVALPAAFVAVAPVAGVEAALAVGGAVATEGFVLAVGTGYRRLHLLPDEPRERVRSALADRG